MSNPAFGIIEARKIKKPLRFVNRFFIHCSASEIELNGIYLTNEIDRWHREERKWSAIGYHYVIDKNGQLITGRNIDIQPAAQKGHNRHTVAVCVHGLYEDKFNEKQFDTLKRLCLRYDELYNGNITFHGHCEVSTKTCPVFDYKSILKLDSFGHLGAVNGKI